MPNKYTHTISNYLSTCFIGLSLLSLFLPFSVYSKTSGFVLENGAKSITIPVDIQNNVILIPIKINGSFEMNFILDTGVKTTIFTEPVLLPWINLQLDSMTRVQVKGLGEGAHIEARMARDLHFSLPGADGYGVNMIVLPQDLISYSGMFGKPVHGIIGYELFGQFIVEINYMQEYVKLHDPFAFKRRRSPKWHSYDIAIEKGKPYIEASLVDHEGTEVKDLWLMDTGASMAISLFNDQLPAPEKSIPAFLGMGLSGNVYGKLGRNPTFKLGNFAFQDVITGYPNPEALSLFPDSLGWYGNIGSEVLSRFRIIFDYPHRKVYLKKNRDYNKGFGYNVSGLEFMSIGQEFDRFIISYIRPGSPADEAGLQLYDEILTLNGVPVEGQNIEALYGSLARKTGRIIRIRLLRGQEEVRLNFRVREQI